MGDPGARSKVLSHGAQSLAPRGWSLVASLHDVGEQRPRVLRVQADAMGLGDELGAYVAQNAACGVWWNRLAQSGESFGQWDANAVYPWQGGAALRITCGSLPGVSRTIYADLRSGDYNLPPCEYVEVHAAVWSPSGGAPPDWRVQAEIAEGMAIESTPMRVTARRSCANDTYRAACIAPPGAYAFEVGGNEPGGGVIASGAATPVTRNYDTGAWTPPTTPHLLVEARVIVERVSGSSPVADDGEFAQPWDATIVWFVR